MPSNDRSCGWVLERLDAFVDGAESDLSDDDRERVARHVESCADCARELALAQEIHSSLSEMAFREAPASVIDRAQIEIESTPRNVVALRPRPRALRWVPAAAAALLLIGAVWIERDQRRAEEVAIAQATHDAAIAFAYLNKYVRRTGDIVEDEVIEQRLLNPVEKAMGKSGVGETKSDPGQS
jgi:hypothetical protein